MSRRFQFSLKALLHAISLLAGSLMLAKWMPDSSHETGPFFFFGASSLFCAAIGALGGRAVAGAEIGLGIALLLLMLVYR
jgi:hypothetical protein